MESANSPAEETAAGSQQQQEVQSTKMNPGLLCNFCSKPGNLKCTVCRSRYCCAECQKSDWKEHKAICKIRKAVNERLSSPECLSMAPAVIAKATETGQILASPTSPKFTITMRPGTVYVGETYLDQGRKPHGVGQLTVSVDGVKKAQFEGTFVNAVIHGVGVFKWFTDEGEMDGIYEGEVMAAVRHGVGKMIESEGSIYEGSWTLDKKEGKGKFTYPNGMVHQGFYKEGKPNGKGVLRNVDGSVQFEGMFQDGKPLIAAGNS